MQGVEAMKFLVFAVFSLTISYLWYSSLEPVILLADLGIPVDVNSILVTATDGC